MIFTFTLPKTKIASQKLFSRKVTYPTLGKGKPSSNVPLKGDMLVPLRVSSQKETSLPVSQPPFFWDTLGCIPCGDDPNWMNVSIEITW